MSCKPSSKAIKNTLNLSNRTKEEEDDQNPACTVYLYKRRIEVTSEKEGSLKSTDIKAKIESFAEHWVLYFDWGYYQAYYEANNDNGKLIYSKGEGKPGAPQGMEFKVDKIKDLRVTRQAVDKKASDNRFNGVDYSVTTANCQNWVVELGRLLGIDMPSVQCEKLLDQGVTLGVGVGVGVGVLAKGITISKRIPNEGETNKKKHERK